MTTHARRLCLFAFVCCLVLVAGSARAQTCAGFTSAPADFADLAPVDLLPEQDWGGPMPIQRGGVDYAGGLLIGTTCPGAYGVLAMCDFSSPATAMPSSGTTLTRWGADYWADVYINPFKASVTLASGVSDTFVANTNSGFVGYCATAGDSIVSIVIEGHDGVATALYNDTGDIGGGDPDDEDDDEGDDEQGDDRRRGSLADRFDWQEGRNSDGKVEIF